MTGFGSHCVETEQARVLVETKSVNGRFLKLSWKGPGVLNRYEHELEPLVKAKLRRGSVNIHVFVEYKNPEDLVSVDETIALAYKAVLENLGLPLSSVPQLPGVIGGKARRELNPELLAAIKEALGGALTALVTMREREGEALMGVVEGLCKDIMAERSAIGERTEEVIISYQARLKDRLAALLEGSGADLDESVVAREVAVMADRSDITEEVDRLEAHVAQIHELLEKGEEVGRTLDFLAQEMLRESNTIGSKSGDVSLARHVITLKTAIERFKEQVANIE
jgi:uncharacterized protein (TIGR00255 family)